MSIGIATGLREYRPRSQGSIFGNDKRSFHLHSVSAGYGVHLLRNGYRSCFPGGIAAWA
jgi:hypothetical protein